MNSVNFLKNAGVRNNRSYNKNLKKFIMACLSILGLMISVNALQIYKVYIAHKMLIIAKQDVEILDSVIQENNLIKNEMKKLQDQIVESVNTIKSNDKILDLVISIANIIPDDAYLQAFSFKPTIKFGIDLPSADENMDKEYGLGKIRLKGYTSSKSITEFLERLSRLESVDNVKLIYLKYPDPGVAKGGVYTEPSRSSGQATESNLLEFSIKLLLNNV